MYPLVHLYLVELKSHHQKGQDHPLAKPVYAIGITLLLQSIKPPATETDVSMKHVAFADDLGGAGDLITN